MKMRLLDNIPSMHRRAKARMRLRVALASIVILDHVENGIYPKEMAEDLEAIAKGLPTRFSKERAMELADLLRTDGIGCILRRHMDGKVSFELMGLHTGPNHAWLRWLMREVSDTDDKIDEIEREKALKKRRKE